MNSKKINSWLSSLVVIVLFYYASRGWVKIFIQTKSDTIISGWAKIIFILHFLIVLLFIIIPMNLFSTHAGELLAIGIVIFEAVYISLGLLFDIIVNV